MSASCDLTNEAGLNEIVFNHFVQEFLLRKSGGEAGLPPLLGIREPLLSQSHGGLAGGSRSKPLFG